jgi:alcohol dehydrogenase
LLAEACRVNIKRIQDLRGPDDVMLAKFAGVGRILSEARDAGVSAACDVLLQTLDGWTQKLSIPRLGAYGVSETDLDGLASQAGQKNNPVQLELDDIKAILRARL